VSARKAWTRRNPSVLSVIEREALTFACPRCNAQPGAWCLTGVGQIAPSLHAPRLDLGALR
jgi:transcription elongation factor Elf1